MSDNIKAIHIGLPETISNKVIWVDDIFRTNTLSLQPGGCDVVVEYVNDNVLGYKRIKSAPEYIRQILVTELTGGNEVEFDSLEEATQLRLTKEIILSAHVRVYKSDGDKQTASFKQIWNSQTSNITLLAALQEPDDFEIEEFDGIETMKLFISEITKSKSGVGFDAKCWETNEHHLIGRTVYCRFRTNKPLRSEFYVATDRVVQIITKAGRTVWIVK